MIIKIHSKKFYKENQMMNHNTIFKRKWKRMYKINLYNYKTFINLNY